MGQILSQLFEGKSVKPAHHTSDRNKNGILRENEAKDSGHKSMEIHPDTKAENITNPAGGEKEEKPNEEKAKNAKPYDGDVGEADREKEESNEAMQLDVTKNGINNNLRLQELKKDNGEFDTHSFLNDVLRRKVVLEDVFVSDKEVSGVIAVSCDEQHPVVTVRYSSDGWETILNERAIPFTASEHDNVSFRRYFFFLFVPSAESLELAVRLKGDFGIYWDNNNYKNYCIKLLTEKESSKSLMGKFSLQKEEMFGVLVKKKSVTLKNVSLKDGKVNLVIATEESFNDFPDVCYTIDDWKSSGSAAEVIARCSEEGMNILEVQIDIPKQHIMECNIS